MSAFHLKSKRIIDFFLVCASVVTRFSSILKSIARVMGGTHYTQCMHRVRESHRVLGVASVKCDPYMWRALINIMASFRRIKFLNCFFFCLIFVALLFNHGWLCVTIQATHIHAHTYTYHSIFFCNDQLWLLRIQDYGTDEENESRRPVCIIKFMAKLRTVCGWNWNFLSAHMLMQFIYMYSYIYVGFLIANDDEEEKKYPKKQVDQKLFLRAVCMCVCGTFYCILQHAEIA